MKTKPCRRETSGPWLITRCYYQPNYEDLRPLGPVAAAFLCAVKTDLAEHRLWEGPRGTSTCLRGSLVQAARLFIILALVPLSMLAVRIKGIRVCVDACSITLCHRQPGSHLGARHHVSHTRRLHTES